MIGSHAPFGLAGCLTLALLACAVGCGGGAAASFGPNKVDIPVLMGARPASTSAAAPAAMRRAARLLTFIVSTQLSLL